MEEEKIETPIDEVATDTVENSEVVEESEVSETPVGEITE